MNTIQTTAKTPKTLTIHTTLFDMLAAMQDEASELEFDVRNTDAHIVSTVAEWMQAGRIVPGYTNPIRSAA
ncbi:MAG: hypothetical protein ETSY1_25415 [Candidatus Entotheonella factor]|uniref:Uncharacterized protein n=1 Tax=Entotheonella factor TaxID=1429438 RepID=W4LFN7_ENTF1|nr:MAG: hypothetical protein ETSY1_25415 [Candidatus Entotheonella factor]